MDSQRTLSPLEKCFAADHELLSIMLGWVIEAIDRKKSHTEVARLWRECASYVSSHMETEERHLLSELALVRERDARALFAEHRHLRDRMTELSQSAANGQLSVSALQTFAGELDAHSAHEERTLYLWSADTFSLGQLSKILHYMNEVTRRRADDAISPSFSPL